MQTGPMQIADIERLAAADAPDLADVVKAFIEQADPEQDGPLREGALSFDTFVTQLKQAAALRTSRRRSRRRRRGSRSRSCSSGCSSEGRSRRARRCCGSPRRRRSRTGSSAG